MVNPKILIVEDENIVAKDLQKRLVNLGYNIVDIVSTGEEAVKKAIATSPDLVLMDLRLKGGMDGIETASALRFQHGIAVVFISAYADNDSLKRASTIEPFGYLLKPFEERELHTTIEMALYRRELERKFKENETWYGTTLRSIGEAVISTDTSGTIKFMNTAAENLTGWKINESLGKDLLKVFRTAEKSIELNFTNPVDQILKNRITAVLKNHATLISREGKEIPIDESASPIIDELGKIVGVVLVFQDVTERKRVQEALKTSQEYAQNIINSSLDMIIASDKNRNIIEFNKAAEETFGYSTKEVLGKHISILFANPEESNKVHKTTVEQGRCVQEVVNKRKNGELFRSLLSASVLRNAKGDMIGVMGVSRDITEKNRAEQALRESEERYRTLVELSPDPIIVHTGGKLVFVNTAAVQIFAGKSPDDLVGRSVVEMVHPDYRVIVKDRILQMSKQGKRVPTIEEKFIRLDGTTFEAEVAAMPFLWQGKFAIQVVLRDVTERIKAEQAIRGSEAKYRTLIENVLDGVYQTTPDGEILTANPALARMLGYESEIDLLLLNIEKELFVDSEERRQVLRTSQ